MKRVLAGLLFIAASLGCAQSYTPNCNLFLAPSGYSPWTTPMNQDCQRGTVVGSSEEWQHPANFGN
jgi:hypothetical protein